MAAPRVTFVIMAGGKGERLWPLVRRDSPKVCQNLDGQATLLQATIRYLRPAWPRARWLVVTTRRQVDAVRKGLGADLRHAVIAEPIGKNTAACIALAATIVARRNPSEVLVVVPADHWIGNPREYQRAVRRAINTAASRQSIVLIGVLPRSAHTGYGYICPGSRVSSSKPSVHHIGRFVEKPTRQTARRLLRQKVYWNSGIFVGTAEQFISRTRAHLPALDRCFSALRKAGRFTSKRLARAYAHAPAVSFDVGVMSHVQDGLVVEGSFPWEDLGSWDTWARLSKASAAAVTIESQNVQVVSQEPHLVAVIGMKNIVVVHTPDVTLLCPQTRAQQVRQVIRQVRNGNGATPDPKWRTFLATIRKELT